MGNRKVEGTMKESDDAKVIAKAIREAGKEIAKAIRDASEEHRRPVLLTPEQMHAPEE